MRNAFLVAGLLIFTVLCSSAAHGDASEAKAADAQQAIQAYGRLPLGFTANQGQADPRVAFFASGAGTSIQLARASAGFTVSRRPTQSLAKNNPSLERVQAVDEILRVSLPGSSRSVSAWPFEELPGKSNYLIGSDPSQWHIGVPTFARVKYASVYPGVDLLYYGSQQQLEFDFVVQPHARVEAVRLEIEGSLGLKRVRLTIDDAGNLVAAGAGGRVLLRKPVLYQVASDPAGSPSKHVIDGGYVLAGGHQVRFRIGAYDASKPLVIDPVVAYSTFLGGPRGGSGVSAIAVDPAGNAFVTGEAFSPVDYPVTPHAFQTASISGFAVFVSKLNPSGTALLYSTYLAGTAGSEGSSAITVDPSGDAYITGRTNSADFPTTAGAFQTQIPGSTSGFVTKLNPTGTSLLYSTFLGGSSGETLTSGVALNSAGEAYVTGETGSPYFPVTPGVLQPEPSKYLTPFSSVNAGFATKLNATGTALVYSTYLGGTSGYNTVPEGIALDPSGDAFITGATSSPSAFPTTAGAFSKVGSGFVLKLDPQAKTLLYSTLLKGSEVPASIAIDTTGAAYVTGGTVNNDLPVTPGAYQTTCAADPYGECAYAFVLKLKPDGSGLAYSTYFGTGPAGDPRVGEFQASTTTDQIRVDAKGDAYVTGTTSSEILPTTPGALQTTPEDHNVPSTHAFFTKFNSTATALLYSTYLGAGDVFGQALAVGPSGNAYVGGEVFEPSTFPTTPGSFQSTAPGGYAVGFVSRFNFDVPFCTLATNLQIDARNERQESFALQASFALASSAALDPTTDVFTFTIGNQSFTIPAASLVKTKSGYSFEGTVDGFSLLVILQEITTAATAVAPTSIHEAAAAPACSATKYALLATGHGGSLGTLNNPVPVAVSLGENSGSAETTAQIVP